MATTQILGLDQQHAPQRCEPRAEAGPGDPATDDQYVIMLHRARGYGLESRSV